MTLVTLRLTPVGLDAGLCLFGCPNGTGVCQPLPSLPWAPLTHGPSFGAGTFQSNSSGAAADTPFSKADPPAGGGTLPWAWALEAPSELPAHVLLDGPVERGGTLGSGWASKPEEFVYFLQRG